MHENMLRRVTDPTNHIFSESAIFESDFGGVRVAEMTSKTREYGIAQVRPHDLVGYETNRIRVYAYVARSMKRTNTNFYKII